MILGDLIEGGLSLFGADAASKSASRDRKLMKEQADRLATVEFNPFTVLTSGGAGVKFGSPSAPAVSADPRVAQAQAILDRIGNTGGGAFGNMIRELAGPVASQGAAAGPAGAPTATLEAGEFAPLQQLFQSIAAPFAAQGAGIAGAANQGLDQLFSAFGSSGALGNLAAQQAAARLNADSFDTVRNETLDLLRAQAQPFEDRAFSNLQDNLFATGRLDSTGGALQTEAFARGLGQADIERQLAATDAAQRTQQLEDNLASSAFERFGATSGLTADLNQAIFGRGKETLGIGTGALAGQQSILDTLLQLGTFGANLGSQDASTRLAAFGGAADSVGQLTGISSPGDIRAAALTSFANNADFGKIADGFKRIFGGSKPTPTTGGGVPSF